MRRNLFRRYAVGVGVLAVVVPLATAASSAAAAPQKTGPVAQFVRSCPIPKAGFAACDALRSLKFAAQASPDASHGGYGPGDLQSAYNLAAASASDGATQTIALVDAYDDPNAASDLATYRSYYGLPACTTASGCFEKVAGNGGTTLPKTNASWAQEESLDIDMASAICPECKIRLVEAASASTSALATAVRTAATTYGATEISNSYGGSETASDPSTAKNFYTYPGVVVTASAGDGGYGVEFPAAAPSVVAVGGTTLKSASNARGWSETVWGNGTLSKATGGTGSGCSKYEAKPAWQKDTGCAKRTVADMSADANPNTGVAVYDSTPYQGSSGWLVFGGTSVSSPIIASIYALAGNAAAHPGLAPAKYAYANRSDFYDVTSGSNGTCTPAYLCTGEVGYDGPTGLGTPDGIAAF